MINHFLYDPMDLFWCNKCNDYGDRDLSIEIDGKLYCEKCEKEIKNERSNRCK